MKALFLYWLDSDRNVPGFFEFEPYLYGPCSFELYDVLRELAADTLIAHAPAPIPQWTDYHLTQQGIVEADKAQEALGAEVTEQLCSIASSVASLEFVDLLRCVYEKAPEFAVNSVIRHRI